jgi:hypothetical protein
MTVSPERSLEIEVLTPNGEPPCNGYEAALFSADGECIGNVGEPNHDVQVFSAIPESESYSIVIRIRPYITYSATGVILNAGANRMVVHQCKNCLPPAIGVPFLWAGPGDLRGACLDRECEPICEVKIQLYDEQFSLVRTTFTDKSGCFKVPELPKGKKYILRAKFPSGRMIVIKDLEVESIGQAYVTITLVAKSQ